MQSSYPAPSFWKSVVDYRHDIFDYPDEELGDTAIHLLSILIKEVETAFHLPITLGGAISWINIARNMIINPRKFLFSALGVLIQLLLIKV